MVVIVVLDIWGMAGRKKKKKNEKPKNIMHYSTY